MDTLVRPQNVRAHMPTRPQPKEPLPDPLPSREPGPKPRQPGPAPSTEPVPEHDTDRDEDSPPR